MTVVIAVVMLVLSGCTLFNSPPVASFTYSPSSGNAPLNVSFDASSSYDPDGSITSYTWSFGDGGSGSGIATTHTYTNAGTYTARLAVTDNDGGTASVSHSIIVTANQPPVANFSYQLMGAALTFQFDAENSYDPDGQIETYRWDLGDNTVKFGQVIQHTFPRYGTYYVRLTVTDDQGAESSTTQQIQIDLVTVFEAQMRNAIDYWDPITRSFAMNCISPYHSGNYSIDQICDIWDTCMKRWVYVSDPAGGVAFNPTPASETIAMGVRGDCDDFAALVAASVEAIGGRTRVIIAHSQDWQSLHAYAEVWLGKLDEDGIQSIADYIATRYWLLLPTEIYYWRDANGDIWLNLDWSARHPGGPYWGQRWLIIDPWKDGRFHPLAVKRKAMDITPFH